EVQELVFKFQTEMERLGIPYSLQITFNEYINEMDHSIALYIKQKIDGAMGSVGKIVAIFTMPVLSFYFMKDRDYFKKVVIGLIPSSIRRNILQMAYEINRILDQFIRGQILIALIVGILSALGYLIIGLPYVAILGLFTGVFEIVPYFGPVLGAIPAVIIAILHSPSKVVATIIVVIVVQQLESNIFTPKIMGDHVGLHPVFIILSLWVGGTFFGILGMFFAVPIILILRVIFKNIYLSIVSSTH
ncbi:MAG TPA: AI-2E family transporter, partial [Clostridia bacterium]|nr:AI-2E family transporter [Clostridia bacterium]